LDHIAHVGVNVSRCLKLFGREIIFDVFQPVCKTYLNVTDRQTDRQTDGQTSYCGITALCVASRGKNIMQANNGGLCDPAVCCTARRFSVLRTTNV